MIMKTSTLRAKQYDNTHHLATFVQSRRIHVISDVCQTFTNRMECTSVDWFKMK